MMDLQDARKIIQEADRQMAALFEKRMAAVREIAAYKKERGIPIRDIEQEKRVLERNSAYIGDDVLRQYYLRFMQDTMDVAKQYQERLIAGARVAYCGVEGAFAHVAARRIFPQGQPTAFSSFDAAYLSVVEGECDYAVLPIENSYAGEVGQVLDLMFHGSLYVNGVYNLSVVHNLLGVPGAKPEDIRTVISHPQALSQCRPYIMQHRFLEQSEENTAVAARRVAAMADPSVAAIAGEETAKLYGLQILDHDINESKDNTTRFAVFARTENRGISEREGSTFIMLFRVNNVAGALAQTLQVIGKHGFNMRVLRSRPIKTTSWKYYFYVEAEGSPETQKGRDMIRELRDHCDMLKIVGQYVFAEDPLKEA
ncbi:MAG: prephenate dehydratase domain-containing protein [Eubacteriales bacterium]|nr:prephenate dehydratase domain-containing protein [Eubacteriales bacterium]